VQGFAEILDSGHYGVMTTPKLHQAMALVAQGIKPFAAARQVGASPSAVYAAIARRRRTPCPCCGSQVDPERIKKIIDTHK
jgi:hypothetical protein